MASEFRIMLVAARQDGLPQGGRALLSRLNREILSDILADRLDIFEIEYQSVQAAQLGHAIFLGYIDGINNSVITRLITEIREKRIRKVIIDGSNFGKLAKVIYERCLDVEVITFFHNCEAKFFFGALRQFKTIRSFGVLIANYLAERCAIGASNKLICLSKRDSNQLQRVYGRSATHIFPMALRDQLSLSMLAEGGLPGERYILFVGGSFYANHAGILWFCENVAPSISIKTRVVGRGFELLKDELERFPNVEVIGAVDSLAPWYLEAEFIVAPIFDGSGMKTKVAEALMYGKRIIGTPEALSGYDGLSDQVAEICSTAAEFITAIDQTLAKPKFRFDPALRAIYEEKYSYSVACSRMAVLLDER